MIGWRTGWPRDCLPRAAAGGAAPRLRHVGDDPRPPDLPLAVPGAPPAGARGRARRHRTLGGRRPLRPPRLLRPAHAPRDRGHGAVGPAGRARTRLHPARRSDASPARRGRGRGSRGSSRSWSPGWAPPIPGFATPSPPTSRSLRDLLSAHLGQEEDDILPVAGEVMSQQEWDFMEEHTRATLMAHRKELGKDVLALQLGLLIASVPEAEREEWVRANVPAPIRLLYLLLMKRRYDSAMRELYPDRPCPRWCDAATRGGGSHVATRDRSTSTSITRRRASTRTSPIPVGGPSSRPRSTPAARWTAVRCRWGTGGPLSTASGRSGSVSPTCSRSSSPTGGSSGTRRRRGTPASSTCARPTPGAPASMPTTAATSPPGSGWWRSCRRSCWRGSCCATSPASAGCSRPLTGRRASGG